MDKTVYRGVSVGELGTNCWILSRGGEIIVTDPGAEPEKILAAVSETEGKVRYILLTHSHFDHIGAAEAVRAACGGQVVISEKDENGLSDGLLNLSGLFGSPLPPVTADMTVKEGDRLPFAGGFLTVMETPGHTKGSVCFIGEELILSGDTLFCRGVGRTDFPGGRGTDLRRSLARLRKLGEKKNCIVLPGHGPQTDLAQEIASNPYLKDIE